MLSNLITSLLIATAVGGTTATAFDNEPKKANESQEQVVVIRTENILNVTWNWNAINDGNTPYYQTTETTSEGWTLNNNYWYKDIKNNNGDKWEIQNRTYLKLTSATKTAEGLDYFSDDYTAYEYLSITRVLTYVDLREIESNDQMNIQRLVIQDQDEVTTNIAEGTQTIEVRTAELSNSTINNYLVGQTPPNEAYQTNSIGYIYNQLKPASSLVNTDSFNYDESEEDYLGSDHLDFAYNYNSIMTVNYIIKYVKWESTDLGWYPNTQRPDLWVYTQVNSLSHNYNIKYAEMVYITSDGQMTPVQTQEIVDIPSIMYTVLTMPFSFISQAFNLTLWAGTPYEINFSNIFLVILSILIILFIIKIITRFMR